MTIKEWNEKMKHYKEEYHYYTWACCQPYVNEEQHQKDIHNRDFYCEKIEKMEKFLNENLAKVLIGINKSRF